MISLVTVDDCVEGKVYSSQGREDVTFLKSSRPGEFLMMIPDMHCSRVVLPGHHKLVSGGQVRLSVPGRGVH